MDTVQLDLFAPAVEIVVRQYASDCGPWHIVDYDPTWGLWRSLCGVWFEAHPYREQADRPARLCRDCERMEGRNE